MAASLDRGEIPLGIYGDPEIFELEVERIFSRNWFFVAHTSEIPNPGDFVVRSSVGGRWIITRDADAQIHVLFNSCRHRGTEVCRVDRGNAAAFTCPYHGWTYKNDGALVGVPSREVGYGEFDEAKWHLHSAPRTEIYHDLIFVNMDPDAPTFLEHIGDFRWYLDQTFGAVSGMEVVGDPLRWVNTINWKSPAENFSGDSYHTRFLHRSVSEVGLIPTFSGGGSDVHIAECSGHSMSMRRAAPGEDSFWRYPPQLYGEFTSGTLDAQQVELARSVVNCVTTIFPNLSFFHGGANVNPEAERCGVLNLQQFLPRSATETEVLTWFLVPKAASDEYKRYAYRCAQGTFGPAGLIGNDDMAIFSGIARAAASPFVRNAETPLNYQMGMHVQDQPIPDWPGPGRAYSSRLEDGATRTFYRHWLGEMTRP